ncbi:hypothetical protein [Vibrio pelagius]|uniref:hypothetical protein n=1 Tax=Vibrio pelagius TaxID=28169 RepID=UPI0021C2ADA9|nr:hypothetical protein [Vibrio pelagius]
MFNPTPATKALVSALVCSALSVCGGASSSGPSTSATQRVPLLNLDLGIKVT